MVYTLLAEGFEEIEALTVVDILRRAGISVNTVSVTGEKIVIGGHGIGVETDILIDDADVSDMLFLPGGMPGVTNLENTPAVKELILNYKKSGKYISAICAAPSILGKMNLLCGRKAACYPGFEEYLNGAEVLYEPVVKDGNILTSRGAGTAAELAFTVVEILKDKETATKLRKGMIYE
ncbi:MAG: DJ-1/PfpI family protein [Clostridia bacterium]|nr:DJ-1/PfpI family protein [Clostridia bacterium]